MSSVRGSFICTLLKSPLLQGVTELYDLLTDRLRVFNCTWKSPTTAEILGCSPGLSCVRRNAISTWIRNKICLILPGWCQCELQVSCRNWWEWCIAGFYLWDKKKLSPPSFFFFLTFRVRWVLSHRFTTLPLYTDGVLFLRIKPIIAVSSEDVMTQLSGFCSRYSNRTGEPALTVPGRVQDVDLFSKSKDFHIHKLFSYKYCGTSGTKSSNIYVTFLFYIT